MMDLPGKLPAEALRDLGPVDGFAVEGYRLELVGYCSACRH